MNKFVISRFHCTAKPCYCKHILSVPWPSDISRLHCITKPRYIANKFCQFFGPLLYRGSTVCQNLFIENKFCHDQSFGPLLYVRSSVDSVLSWSQISCMLNKFYTLSEWEQEVAWCERSAAVFLCQIFYIHWNTSTIERQELAFFLFSFHLNRFSL